MTLRDDLMPMATEKSYLQSCNMTNPDNVDTWQHGSEVVNGGVACPMFCCKLNKKRRVACRDTVSSTYQYSLVVQASLLAFKFSGLTWRSNIGLIGKEIHDGLAYATQNENAVYHHIKWIRHAV